MPTESRKSKRIIRHMFGKGCKLANPGKLKYQWKIRDRFERCNIENSVLNRVDQEGVGDHVADRLRV